MKRKWKRKLNRKRRVDCRCLDSSKLYLIQNVVPVKLASKISLIITKLRRVKLSLDPYEKEAGEAVKLLLKGYGTGNSSGNERINVMAEIDVPGHGESWGIGYPDLWPSTSCKEPLDVSKNFTFEVLSEFYKTCARYFLSSFSI
ncbi:hypothetical protein L2E82_16286 [Cichorium intybus]|uniref:Uncharacterized protein n=1 Tax=Cichorium intybus TaxID=13427 RepID=A0ACB9F562_CICIN|nr:hypothetical protein L2E82_16286 [Cichorium intybus]